MHSGMQLSQAMSDSDGHTMVLRVGPHIYQQNTPIPQSA